MTPRIPVLTALLAAAVGLRAEAPVPAPSSVSGTAVSSPAAPVDAPARKLHGRVENNRYYAPGDAFSVPVPVFHGTESAIMDNPEIVVFKDKVSTLLTIAAFKMPAYAKWEFEGMEPKDYLIAFFRDNILRDYRHEFPESTIESARFLPEIYAGAMVAFTLMPGGSAFSAPAPASPLAPAPVAKRGHLVFVRNGYIYVIATELAERVTQPATYKLTTQEEDRLLFGRLATVLEALRFGPDVKPSAAAPASTADEDDDDNDDEPATPAAPAIQAAPAQPPSGN
jgi:hypothetical protein